MISIINEEHPDFVRLYWKSDKNKIKQILSSVNVKYLRGLIYRFFVSYDIPLNDLRIFIRYDGYQFLISRQDIIKELNRRGF